MNDSRSKDMEAENGQSQLTIFFIFSKIFAVER